MKKRIIAPVLLGCCICFSVGTYALEEVDLRGIQSDWHHYRVVEPDSVLANMPRDDEWCPAYDYTIDADIARRLGDEAIKWYWGEDVLKHTKYEVCEVEGKDYFVITRKPKYIFGATYQVCISKTDGAILRAEKL